MIFDWRRAAQVGASPRTTSGRQTTIISTCLHDSIVRMKRTRGGDCCAYIKERIHNDRRNGVPCFPIRNTWTTTCMHAVAK